MKQIRDDNSLKDTENKLHSLKKEIKDLEQDLILTKIDLAQAKGELDVSNYIVTLRLMLIAHKIQEYEYQIDEFKRLLKMEDDE